MRRITLLAATLIALATSLGAAAAASAAPAAFAAKDDGYGPTLAAAQLAARHQLVADFGPCTNIVVFADGQLSDGTWWAEAAGACQSFH
jgi:hypothetical protein